MSLSNPNKPVTEQRLAEFFNKIKGYLGYSEMPSADLEDVINPLPSVASRRHTYSTSEQIVGTWIDGKPIYQKTISGTLASSVNVESTIGTITNLSELVFAFGKVIRSSTRHDIISSPFIAVYNNGTNIVAYNTNNGLTSKTVYITVQYINFNCYI